MFDLVVLGLQYLSYCVEDDRSYFAGAGISKEARITPVRYCRIINYSHREDSIFDFCINHHFSHFLRLPSTGTATCGDIALD